MENLGKSLVVMGSLMIFIGGLIWLGSRVSWLRLGRLPGDIAIERENGAFYFPITTMILLSVILTFIMWLIGMVRR